MPLRPTPFCDLVRRYLYPLVVTVILSPVMARAQQTAPASVRLNELGPENGRMAQRAGLWDVTETAWDAPDGPPVVKNLVATRTMIGAFLEEILAPAPDSTAKDVKRLDYLSFNRVEGRWKYVSMDTRDPVGLMTAASYGRVENGAIHLTFDPFAVVGSGVEVTGQLLRLEQTITEKDADHDQKDQYLVMADGTGERRLAHRYEYARRP